MHQTQPTQDSQALVDSSTKGISCMEEQPDPTRMIPIADVLGQLDEICSSLKKLRASAGGDLTVNENLQKLELAFVAANFHLTEYKEPGSWPRLNFEHIDPADVEEILRELGELQ